MRYQAPRGTQDVLPPEAQTWLDIETTFREVSRLYGYGEVRTPTFEDLGLFVRSSGETSEIVTKQMYEFTDKGGRQVALKPEGTAPVIRALIEHNLCGPGSICRLSYVTPIFRYERPQKGRLRESHQLGLELIGSDSPAADSEIIEMTAAFYKKIGLAEIVVKINSIGRSECRAAYGAAVLQTAETWLRDQDEETRARAAKNPLRMLDSKDPALQDALSGAPAVLEYLEPDSAERFDRLQECLGAAEVTFQVDPRIVRGLDYYTETVFEVQSTQLGAQSALCGGGRYDNLVRELGGPDLPAVGVAMGIERALIVMGLEPGAYRRNPLDVYVVAASPDQVPAAGALVRSLRSAGMSATWDLDKKTLKAQLKQADRLQAAFAAILGEEEAAARQISVRDMKSSEQHRVSDSEIISFLKPRL